jgi:D-alanyl-lipoteichoic acid acyltransferase DltB (MBOAT superfamily)
MSFISPEFVLFFCAFFALYFFLRPAWRVGFILLASYAFYAYGHARYLWIIVLTTAIDYMAGRMIGTSTNPRTRRAWLAASITVNLGVLFTFKYFNFFNGAAESVVTGLGGQYPIGALSLALPVGISFYTFQSMAYTIDVYRGRISPETNVIRFSAFVAYWPQLVAGPIERAGAMLPQFQGKAAAAGIGATADEARIVSGLQQMLWGFFKKVVIADRLALYVNAVYNDIGAYTGLPLVIATVFFAFQIYCDFSAYSDIAIGAARVMGFTLQPNFRQPFLASSVREFWNRWHISLSTWFRDYVYIPLGGSRVPLPRYLLNLFAVFLISGLWHGASWTFVLWGALHGVFVVAEALIARARAGAEHAQPASRARHIGGVVLTFTLVCTAFVFFRANSLPDAAYLFAHVLVPYTGDVSAPFAAGLLAPPLEMISALALIAFLLVCDGLAARGVSFAAQPRVVRWTAYYAMTALVIAAGWYGSGAAEFIYFQF